MAAPTISGIALLLQEHYNNLNNSFMTAASMKGLLCHTADDDTNYVGPDPYFGWGLVNAKSAAELITAASNNSASIVESKLETFDVYEQTIYVAEGQSLKATLCWNDFPGTANSGQLNNTTPVLVNDLDLRISKDGEEYYPWKRTSHATVSGYCYTPGGILFYRALETITRWNKLGIVVSGGSLAALQLLKHPTVKGVSRNTYTGKGYE